MREAQNLILTIAAKGVGKISSSHDYPLRGRGGQGVTAFDKRMPGGLLVASFPVEMSDQIMLATSTGQSIRCPVQDISFRSRSAGGVRVFNTAKGEEVVSVARIADQGDEDEAEELAVPAGDGGRGKLTLHRARNRPGQFSQHKSGKLRRLHAQLFTCIRQVMTQELHIVGGGMAGSEAAWQAANAGLRVVLHEMRPKVATFAHQSGNFAEMVCSNSFRSDDDERNAVGQLHWEMSAADGLIMQMARQHRLPAGGALAVDREAFAQSVTEKLRAHENISFVEEEVTELPSSGHWIFATGPLTSPALGSAIAAASGCRSSGVFRRHRSDRICREHRHVRGLAAVAL